MVGRVESGNAEKEGSEEQSRKAWARRCGKPLFELQVRAADNSP